MASDEAIEREHNFDGEAVERRHASSQQCMIWKPNGYIYLRSDPDKCLQRINKRGRLAEKNITLEYIQQLHELHEKNYKEAQSSNMNIIAIDVENKSISDICSEILLSNLYNDIVY